MRTQRPDWPRWVVAALLLVACDASAPTPSATLDPPTPNPAAAPGATHADAARYPARAVTADIQAGIERHIERESAKHGGFFHLDFQGQPLQLKLVRVHIEYLAALSPTRNFACVDLVDTQGEVYDVDFFMEGPPEDMTVVEATVHKTNGKPLYAWAQKPDRTWDRVPIEAASSKLLDVIEGRDRFEFVYEAALPALKAPARMWLPIPTTDAFQTVTVQSIQAPGQQAMIKDAAYGNQLLLLELAPTDGGKPIVMRFTVDRVEKGAYAEPLPDPSAFLKEDKLVPFTDEIRANAARAIEGKQTDLMRARALYDHTIDTLSYKKVGDGWGKGDATYACDSRSGNCSDYHAYFIGAARAVGIPARFAVGAAIPANRDDGGISGYHCWAEFYADGKWWPVDISEADKYTNLSTYYFGHHPANRVELSRGRDLTPDPAPASGPINFLAYPVLEVNGEVVRVKTTFSFTRLPLP
jgi:transglutaminase-like putative cysteine protease